MSKVIKDKIEHIKYLQLDIQEELARQLESLGFTEHKGGHAYSKILDYEVLQTQEGQNNKVYGFRVELENSNEFMEYVKATFRHRDVDTDMFYECNLEIKYDFKEQVEALIKKFIK